MISFGTGGWRAIIGEDFTKENIQKLSKALADKMKAEGVTDKGIVMGYDRRFLAKEAMQWAAMVFAAEGITCYLVNRSSPTPLIMYYVMKHELSYGMMITASHNPAIYNGIKVFTRGGRDATKEQTDEIEAYIGRLQLGDVKEIEYKEGVSTGVIQEIYPLNEYLDSIIEAIDMDKIREKGMRIAIDPMYGVSETSLTIILHTARCEVKTIHDRHDTLFGGKLPSPSANTLRSLQNTVIDGHYDLGIATDGDADRIGIIDDNGRFLHSNEILTLLYYYLLRYKRWTGCAVRNIATTHMLDKVAARFGESCFEVPVGFKYISAKMMEYDAVIGGESSGGLTVRGHINGKDGIYAAMLLVEMIAMSGKKLSEIYQEIVTEFGSSYMEEKDYSFTHAERDKIHHVLLVEKQTPTLPVEVERISYKDGVKMYFKNNGWVIARFSGTEPLLRVFCEMPTKEEAVEICEVYEKFIYQSIKKCDSDQLYCETH